MILSLLTFQVIFFKFVSITLAEKVSANTIIRYRYVISALVLISDLLLYVYLLRNAFLISHTFMLMHLFHWFHCHLSCMRSNH